MDNIINNLTRCENLTYLEIELKFFINLLIPLIRFP